MTLADFSQLTGWLLFAWAVGFGGGKVYRRILKIGQPVRRKILITKNGIGVSFPAHGF